MINLYDFEKEESKVAKKIFSTVLKIHDISKRKVSVDITMVSNEEIRELNKTTRGIDKVTDVLSYPAEMIKFPFDISQYSDSINPENNTLYLGEIMISRDVMKEQAKEYGHSESRECAFLITHGLLHLLGYDHIDELDRKVMNAKEDEVLTKAKYFR